MTTTPTPRAVPVLRTEPDPHAGLRLGLLAMMAVWGGNVSVVKLLLGQMDAMALSVARMVSATLLLLVVLRWRSPAMPQLAARTWAALVGCGLLMVYVNQIAFTCGIQRTTAANAALIIALNPLVSSLGAAWVFGDRLSLRRLAGVVLGFGGVAAVVLHRPGVSLGGAGLGDALVFGSVLSWVGGGMIVQRLARRLDTGFISTFVTTVGAVALVLHVSLDPGTRWPDAAGLAWWVWPLVATSGISATALGSLVWNRGVQVLGMARTALFVYWVPIFGVAVAVTLLGEPLTLWHLVGLAAVLGGTWLGTRGH